MRLFLPRVGWEDFFSNVLLRLFQCPSNFNSLSKGIPVLDACAPKCSFVHMYLSAACCVYEKQICVDCLCLDVVLCLGYSSCWWLDLGCNPSASSLWWKWFLWTLVWRLLMFGILILELRTLTLDLRFISRLFPNWHAFSLKRYTFQSRAVSGPVGLSDNFNNSSFSL